MVLQPADVKLRVIKCVVDTVPAAGSLRIRN